MTTSFHGNTPIVREAIQSIRQERIRQGLTQREAAERAGISPPMWGSFESDSKPVSLAKLEQMAEAVGCGISLLVVPTAIDAECNSSITCE